MLTRALRTRNVRLSVVVVRALCDHFGDFFNGTNGNRRQSISELRCVNRPCAEHVFLFVIKKRLNEEQPAVHKKKKKR